MNHIWVIEWYLDGEWLPTIGCGITKDDAKSALKNEWKSNNPNDKFRIVKYVSKDKGRGI